MQPGRNLACAATLLGGRQAVPLAAGRLATRPPLAHARPHTRLRPASLRRGAWPPWCLASGGGCVLLRRAHERDPSAPLQQRAACMLTVRREGDGERRTKVATKSVVLCPESARCLIFYASVVFLFRKLLNSRCDNEAQGWCVCCLRTTWAWATSCCVSDSDSPEL